MKLLLIVLFVFITFNSFAQKSYVVDLPIEFVFADSAMEENELWKIYANTNKNAENKIEIISTARITNPKEQVIELVAQSIYKKLIKTCENFKMTTLENGTDTAGRSIIFVAESSKKCTLMEKEVSFLVHLIKKGRNFYAHCYMVIAKKIPEKERVKWADLFKSGTWKTD